MNVAITKTSAREFWALKLLGSTSCRIYAHMKLTWLTRCKHLNTPSLPRTVMWLTTSAPRHLLQLTGWRHPSISSSNPTLTQNLYMRLQQDRLNQEHCYNRVKSRKSLFMARRGRRSFHHLIYNKLESQCLVECQNQCGLCIIIANTCTNHYFETSLKCCMYQWDVCLISHTTRLYPYNKPCLQISWCVMAAICIEQVS